MSSLLHDVVANAPDLAPTTREKYLRDLNAWIRFAGDNPRNWTRIKAQDFYNSLLNRMKPQSATRLMASVQYASKWWAHRENRPDLDFATVRLAKAGETIEKRVLTEEEAKELIIACGHYAESPTPQELRDRAMIVVWLETGMRRMSLQSMTLTNTKIDREAISKANTPYPHALVRLKGQGNKLFTAPLSDAAVAAIIPWRAWLNRDIGPMFCGTTHYVDANGETKFIANNKAMSFTSMQVMLESRANQAGIGHIYPHVMRHTFITWRTQAGLQPHEVASVTGHALKLGALSGYMSMKTFGEKARNSTPGWLKELMGV